MRIPPLHSWNVTIPRARSLQTELREEVLFRPLSLHRVRRVAGADIAIDPASKRLVAAVVVMDFPSLEIVEERVVARPLRFPYVPGYLSFREAPAILACLRRVRASIDVLLCDGQGIAHPRGLGLASHVGLWIGVPTVGCAKSRLVGEHRPVRAARGSWTGLYVDGERVGSVLRTRDGVRPLYVSPGHLIDHASCRRIVLACASHYRLPEPQRLADILAGREKRRRSDR
jgi:deoxyribonuclease V